MHLHSCSTHLMAGSTHLMAGQRCSDLVSSTEYSLTIFAGVVQGNHLYTVGRKSLEVMFGNAQSVPPGQPICACMVQQAAREDDGFMSKCEMSLVFKWLRFGVLRVVMFTVDMQNDSEH